MKQLSALLLSATFLLLPGAGAPEGALAAPQTNFTTVKKKGNWSTRRRAAPARRTTPRDAYDFLNIFTPQRSYRQPLRDATGAGNGNPRNIVALPPEKPKIYTYPAPRTVPLVMREQAEAPAGGMAMRIHRVLTEGLADFPVMPEHRKAIVAFYRERGFAPAWTTESAIQERAFAVLETLARAGDVALDPALYRVPVVWEADGDLNAFAGAPERLARLDVELTAAALRYARHASGGQVDPNKLSIYHDLKPPRVSPAKALKTLAESPNPAEWLNSLHPRHPAFGIMKREYARLKAEARNHKPLPPIVDGPVIRPGDFDERIPLIRQYLQKAGHAAAQKAKARVAALDTEAAGGEETVTDAVAADGRFIYDEALVKAVRRFQRQNGLKPDGIIGRRTLARLNALREKGPVVRLRKLELNMERLRWMPRDFGHEHFLVNQPAYEVYLVRDGKTVWKSRVVIGKPTNQTAFFSDVMEYMEFNPYWGVPQSIITKEMMPKLLRDPGWLDKQGYELYDRKGRRISSWDVPWEEYAGKRKVPFDVRQPPGEKNALGRMKFMFPNAHAIYMHDTPMRHLFKRRKRAFSHGCVRVAKPWEMAKLVTGLSEKEIHRHVDSGKNHKLILPRKIPVHLAYFTAWPDDQGRIHYYEDVYGRDRLLRKALNKVRKALRVPVPTRAATEEVSTLAEEL